MAADLPCWVRVGVGVGAGVKTGTKTATRTGTQPAGPTGAGPEVATWRTRLG